MISNNSLALRLFSVAMAVGASASVLHAQTEETKATQKEAKAKYPPEIEGATVMVYKKIGDVKLNAYIFGVPNEQNFADRRPAIVFFFGGGWKSGSPTQFEHHCRYLAQRGMVAITADYRVASRHGVPAVDCVSDAKSAIRWVRQNARRLGVDPERIVAAGGSAGGHIAACTGTVKSFDEENEDVLTSSVPNAMALFNPALIVARVEGESLGGEEQKWDELRERMGVEAELLSPFHQVKEQVPPTIIFHGKADSTVPYKTAELFCQAMLKAGNQCELVGYEDQTHGFFNYGRADGKHYQLTLDALDRFLVSLGYLTPLQSKE